MERKEKIVAVIEFMEENNIKIIETANIQVLIIDAQFVIDAEDEQNEYEYGELIDKGLTDKDLKLLNSYLEDNLMMMIKTDDVQGVSFENCELSSEMLYESVLWEDEDKEEAPSIYQRI